MTALSDVPAVATSHLDAAAAVVLSVPHGGTRLPGSCAEGLRVPAADLWSDWHSAELYDLTGELAVPTVIARLSRFVADPNRAPVEPLHGDFWSTAVPAQDPAGVPLYDRVLTARELQERLELAHAPYHRALDRAVAAALRRHPRVLLLDLHSFGVPLGVDVVLGDGHGSTAGAAATDRVEQALLREGFTVARNLRFTGGHIVRRWAGDDRVDAVQLELDQRRYLRSSDVEAHRPRPRRDPAGWTATRLGIAAAVRSLASGER
ncbi:formiminoglutamase [Blastococcus aurantiacus]|uniref:Formiminoglutamase n=1 Tax=Blastococcus aurantiacus TaxID=1550231 RepID=A0A1G7P0R9_9ACTN|nr:N-formylglutamate amidohydrolase [Blastococcus aurantiacus]SDF79814.1 formiminoglutamase [Blastococcus aurantiacus]